MNLLLKKSLDKILKIINYSLNTIAFICSMLAIVYISYLFGFYTGVKTSNDNIHLFKYILHFYIFLPPIYSTIRYLKKERDIKKTNIFLFIVTAITIILEINHYSPFLGFKLSNSTINTIIIVSVSISSLTYISQAITRLLTRFVNPMAIFTTAFFFIIMIGTIMLSFPNCTRFDGSLDIIDALFISTSATCVTGLCPVDFVGTFTLYGQIVVLILIQIGGLGVITITSFFALSIMGAIPYSSTLMIKDLVADSKDNNISSLITRIISTTIAIEIIGAFMIFFSIGHNLSDNTLYNIYFAVFHSISAFCNAGFSISQTGLCIPELLSSNSFYYSLSALIILGGIGFPIYSNIINNLKIHINNLFQSIKRRRVKRYIHEWDLNSLVVLKMTAILILGGTAYFLIFEWHGMLDGLSITQKITQAFYNATLPRTAGFSSQDISTLKPLTYIVLIMLMFIGGAPQSTAGGIKVTSFYILIKNAISIVKGMNRLEIGHREISKISINRAFAAIGLSVLVILFSLIALLFTDPLISTHKLLFEVVSALGTVGSSMNVTGNLSSAGKIIITITMFIGRIGIVTLLASFIKQHKNLSYKYPQGHIIVS